MLAKAFSVIKHMPELHLLWSQSLWTLFYGHISALFYPKEALEWMPSIRHYFYFPCKLRIF